MSRIGKATEIESRLVVAKEGWEWLGETEGLTANEFLLEDFFGEEWKCSEIVYSGTALWNTENH